MQAAAVRNLVLDRAHDLSPERFEVLCKVVLADGLRTTSLTVTPASQDGGIDIEGRLNYDWFSADFGVQVKRYARDDRVSSDRVHRLAGALVDNDYHLGTFVTTSSYTRPAVETAERLPVELVTGDELAEAMISSGIGVRCADGEYDLEPAFWQSLGETAETIPASEVPLGSNFDRIRAVLTALKHTPGTKPEIQSWVRERSAVTLSDRHVYINANSAAVLGLARKEPPTDARDVQRWGLTARGAEYLAAPPDSRDARRALARAIRSVDLIDRLLADVRDASALTADDLDARIEAETTGLSTSSVRRRASSVRKWLATLPEVDVEDSRSGKSYQYVPDDEPDAQSDR